MSGSRVSISAKAARLLGNLEGAIVGPEAKLYARAFAELTAALRPKPKKASKRLSLVTKAHRYATKKEETAAIYRFVEARAAGKCEACGEEFSPSDPPHMDHQLGRGKAKQSIRNCWLIHGLSCHAAKHRNAPTPEFWWERIRAFAIRLSYWDTARLAGAKLDYVLAKKGADRAVALLKQAEGRAS